MPWKRVAAPLREELAGAVKLQRRSFQLPDSRCLQVDRLLPAGKGRLAGPEDSGRGRGPGQGGREGKDIADGTPPEGSERAWKVRAVQKMSCSPYCRVQK